jgi:hypothetical protein
MMDVLSTVVKVTTPIDRGMKDAERLALCRRVSGLSGVGCVMGCVKCVVTTGYVS